MIEISQTQKTLKIRQESFKIKKFNSKQEVRSLNKKRQNRLLSKYKSIEKREELYKLIQMGNCNSESVTNPVPIQQGNIPQQDSVPVPEKKTNIPQQDSVPVPEKKTNIPQQDSVPVPEKKTNIPQQDSVPVPEKKTNIPQQDSVPVPEKKTNIPQQDSVPVPEKKTNIPQQDSVPVPEKKTNIPQQDYVPVPEKKTNIPQQDSVPVPEKKTNIPQQDSVPVPEKKTNIPQQDSVPVPEKKTNIPQQDSVPVPEKKTNIPQQDSVPVPEKKTNIPQQDSVPVPEKKTNIPQQDSVPVPEKKTNIPQQDSVPVPEKKTNIPQQDSVPVPEKKTNIPQQDSVPVPEKKTNIPQQDSVPVPEKKTNIPQQDSVPVPEKKTNIPQQDSVPVPEKKTNIPQQDSVPVPEKKTNIPQQNSVPVPEKKTNIPQVFVHTPSKKTNLSKDLVPAPAKKTNVSQNLVSVPVAKTKISQQAKALSNSILTKFSISKQLLDILNRLSFTQNQAKDLAQGLISGVINLQKPESKEEEVQVKALFNKINTKMIADEKLFYYEMVDKLKKNNVSQASKSTIYHTIANIKKEKDISNQYENKWYVMCIRNNGYNKLSDSELKQIVKYESIADKTRQIGQKLGFKLQSIKKQSLKMTHFLLECMQKYIEVINQMKYDLSFNEVMKMAQISRQACNYYDQAKDFQHFSKHLCQCSKHLLIKINILKYLNGFFTFQKNKTFFLQFIIQIFQTVISLHIIKLQTSWVYDNGVYVLLVYLVQSCKRLQQQSKSIQEIQQLLIKAIDEISKKYPPGQGLSKENQELIKTLRELQNPANYRQVNFNHQEIRLTSSNKQLQVEEIITKYACIAEQCKELFEELVKTTCLAKCVYFKIGLKYYPNNPNKKALTRIKEKMFFKKDAKQSEKKINGANLKEILDKEQIAYRSIIDQILKTTDKVQFKISDMVRGKCVFLQVNDIIQSVNQIKQFAANNPKFGIKQIESRFTNAMPISDVTLKIVLDNQIVAQLQLTIQTNAATYNFAHKIYQLQRSKVFSKLKITHNYFQESKDEFSQLARKAIELQVPKLTISSSISNSISNYLKLDFKSKQFSLTLQEIIQKNKKQLKKLTISVDPFLQDLIIVAFKISIGQWGKQIGKALKKALKDEKLSPKLKSVALSTFLNKLYLPNESQNMQQFGISREQLDRKVYFEEYLKQYYQIQNISNFTKQNSRVYYRNQQLQKIQFQKYFSSNVLRTRIIFVENIIIESQCIQKIKTLKEIFSLYFVNRSGNGNFQQFNKYFQQISNLFSKQNQDTELLKNQIQIIHSQYLLRKDYAIQAYKQLQKSRLEFKSREKYSKVMQCQILLAQCFIKTSNYQQFNKYIDYYDINVIKKAEILGQNLKGVLYADSLWRISQYLSKKIKNNQMPQLLKYFTAMAISQYSQCIQGQRFIYIVKETLKKYDDFGLNLPQMKAYPNKKQVYINSIGEQEAYCLSKVNWKNITSLKIQFGEIGATGCKHLSKADWKNITTLDLYGNNIGDEGCLHLSKADWKNITTLNLSNNKIGGLGCLHLSKADWKNTTTLDLCISLVNKARNNIRNEGCQHLSKADWKNITTLYLSNNNIGGPGCQHLSKADWKNITTLSLTNNNIEDEGCQHLNKTEWKNINQLYLYGNNIGDEGCLHLSKADWKNITTLNLSNNKIGGLGCLHLSKADWKNTTTLDLSNNSIRATGCSHLSKANWKNITTLYLNNSKIGAAGCQHLSKADWKNIKNLQLYDNDIGAVGCQHLSKANWKNIIQLNLWSNNIGAAGCQHLSRADWKNITNLSLTYNNIGDKGCQHLSKADWKNITTLSLNQNNLGDAACQYLSKANWKNITKLQLYSNRILYEGCQHLSKANWKNLKYLNLKQIRLNYQVKQKILSLFPKQVEISL